MTPTPSGSLRPVFEHSDRSSGGAHYRNPCGGLHCLAMHPIPVEQRWLFWDVDLNTVEPERDAAFILGRVLERGRLFDVRWAIRRYGLERIHTFLRDAAHTELSERTTIFWRALLNAEDEAWESPPLWRRNNSAPWTS